MPEPHKVAIIKLSDGSTTIIDFTEIRFKRSLLGNIETLRQDQLESIQIEESKHDAYFRGEDVD